MICVNIHQSSLHNTRIRSYCILVTLPLEHARINLWCIQLFGEMKIVCILSVSQVATLPLKARKKVIITSEAKEKLFW